MDRATSSKSSGVQTVSWLLLAVAVVYLLGLHWWWTAPMRAMGQQMDELGTQELRMRMTAHQRPAIEKRLAQVRQIEAAQKRSLAFREKPVIPPDPEDLPVDYFPKQAQ